MVVTSIKIWAKEWINSKCSSCNNKIWEIKAAEDFNRNNTTIKWCLAHRSISKSRVLWVSINQWCKIKWVSVVEWVWWVQCKDKICHLTWAKWLVWVLVLRMDSNSNSLREITLICLLCMLEIYQIKHLILICSNSLIPKDIKLRVQKLCLTKNRKDQKDLVILISIPKKRLIDAWPRWIMHQLMIDVLSLIEKKIIPVALIVKPMFWLEIFQKKQIKKNWTIYSKNLEQLNLANSKFMEMVIAEDLVMFNLKHKMELKKQLKN